MLKLSPAQKRLLLDLKQIDDGFWSYRRRSHPYGLSSAWALARRGIVVKHTRDQINAWERGEHGFLRLTDRGVELLTTIKENPA